MSTAREGTGSEPTETRRTIYECGCVLMGAEPRSATDPRSPRQPLTCPVHRAIWADKRPLDREVERIADTLDGDLHLHHADGPCEPINPTDLVGHVLNQAGLAGESGRDEQTEAAEFAVRLIEADVRRDERERTVAAVVDAARIDPALVTDALVARVAAAIEDAVEGTDGSWESLAREALRAAGFQVPGGGDG